jgi:tRNA dimethylallyltransferase
VAAPLVAIVGPTASGKSALALRLARARGGEIVSCDSLQVFRGLDIGSAKPSPEERRAVPHHLIDVVGPGDAFSAAEYARLARAALAEIRERGRLAVVAGGTGLYLRALLEGLFEGPSRDEALRRRLEKIAARFGSERLHRLLGRIDPEAAGRIRPRDRVRIVRAIEVFRATGRTLSEKQREGAMRLSGFRVLVLGLAPERARLREAVALRAREMLARGLVAEVRGLVEGGLSPEVRPLQAIGYRQALGVLRGELLPLEAEQAIVQETMRYAKRQMTWFRHQTDVLWVRDAEEGFEAALAFLDGPAEPRG